MELHIRKASIDDAFFLAKILVSSWNAAYKNLVP